MLVPAFMSLVPHAATPDLRNIVTGHVIPDEGYCDQPYVVVTDDGNRLCVLTTGSGKGGHRAQHIVATSSRDEGRTWSEPIDIEPPGPPEASWAMPLKVPSGRVYVFYTYNTSNIATWDGKAVRADSFGDIAFKYSDDHGHTWSPERYRIPQRRMEIDHENFFGGTETICWCVGKPIIAGDRVYFGGSKVGHPAVGPGPTEGVFFMSRNILTEPDPGKIHWRLLPEGDHGLRAPEGHIAEEQNLVQLSNGDLYCVYRTVDGFLCAATSTDGGRTWSGPEYARYEPGGRPIKNPRGPAFIRKFSNLKYLLLFYNHGGRDFSGRNPYWLSGGVEVDGTIHWSEPEICLYDDDRSTRIGYPDYIKHEGRYWLTETNKSVARVHELDGTMLRGLWRQHRVSEVAREGLVLDVENAEGTIDFPRLPSLERGGGFTLDLWITLDEASGGQTVLDTCDASGKGVVLTAIGNGTIRIDLSDGAVTDGWDCDPGLLEPGRRHQVVAIVDGGPRLITFVVDGVLCDGSEARQQGWHRFRRDLSDVNGEARAQVGMDLRGTVHRLRIYDRYLRTSEAVGNWRAGRQDR